MIPARIILNAEYSFPILQKNLKGKLGYLDRGTGEIALEENQPEAGKHVILLHELLHMTAEMLIQAGTLKRQPPEAFIESAAPVLLSLLVNSGLWNGLSAAALSEFVESQIAGDDGAVSGLSSKQETVIG